MKIWVVGFRSCEDEISSLRADYRKLKETSSRQDTEICILQDKMEMRSTMYIQHMQQASALAQEILSLQCVNNQQAKEISSLKRGNKKLINKNKEMALCMTTYTQQAKEISSLQHENKTLTNKNNEMERELAIMAKKRSSLRNENEKLKASREKGRSYLQHENEKLKDQIKELKDQMQDSFFDKVMRSLPFLILAFFLFFLILILLS